MKGKLAIVGTAATMIGFGVLVSVGMSAGLDIYAWSKQKIAEKRRERKMKKCAQKLQEEEERTRKDFDA